MPEPNDLEVLLRVVRERRSIRRFQARAVSREDLEPVLEAARWAPSAGNRQAFRLIVVTNRATIEAMGEAVHRANARLLETARPGAARRIGDYVKSFEHFLGAPTVIAATFRRGVDLLAAGTAEAAGKPGATPSRSHGEESMRSTIGAVSSVAAAIMNLQLATHAAGLGSCWMTGPLLAAETLREILDVPEGWDLAALIPVGYPDEEPAAPNRRSLSTLARYIE